MWPPKTLGGHNGDVSEDTHNTLAEAQAVCRRLEEHGLGGEGKIFPLETKVETNN